MSPQELRVYQQQDGTQPFNVWIAELRDRQARARIRTRMSRLAPGNFGDCKALDGGVSELRVDWGPGYRVYYGMVGGTVVLLLTGGSPAVILFSTS